MDETLAEIVTDAWNAILDEIEAAEERGDAAAARGIGAAALQALRDLAASADMHLHEVRAACEDALGSSAGRVGIRERYAVALEILRADGIDESDILLVARQANPRGCLHK